MNLLIRVFKIKYIKSKRFFFFLSFKTFEQISDDLFFYKIYLFSKSFFFIKLALKNFLTSYVGSLNLKQFFYFFIWVLGIKSLFYMLDLFLAVNFVVFFILKLLLILFVYYKIFYPIFSLNFLMKNYSLTFFGINVLLLIYSSLKLNQVLTYFMGRPDNFFSFFLITFVWCLIIFLTTFFRNLFSRVSSRIFWVFLSKIYFLYSQQKNITKTPGV